MNKSDFEEKSTEWLMGYLSACYNYGVWHDGVILLGCGMTKYADIKNIIQPIIESRDALKKLDKETAKI